LRDFLTKLEQAGALRRIPHPVDPRFEVSAYLTELPDTAVLFEKISGHDQTIVGNLLPSRQRIALGLETDSAGLQNKIVAAIRHPEGLRLVSDAPCQEVVLDQPDLARLPIPSFFEHETGPYITAGAIVAADPETGKGNLSIARLKPLGGNRAFIGIAPNHHLAQLARRAAERGETLPIAVTIGNHPAVMIAAALYLGLGEDERAVAGALFGEALEVVRCRTSDLLVPAQCEMVLEGVLHPGQPVEEGPVSEFHGMYERYGSGQLVEFHCLTRRRDAIFQVIQPGYNPEHIWIGGEAIAAGLAHRLGASFPGLRQVAVTPGGAGRLHAVVAIDSPGPDEGRRIIEAVWKTVSLVKMVTVVDADIDPWHAERVEYAVATRLRADKDLIVVPNARADRAEPLEHDGVVAKLGLDATRKDSGRPDWTAAAPPPDILERVRKRLAREV
jgi:4-hydroxy-3-polyprenylbenzoate decarboxylase